MLRLWPLDSNMDEIGFDTVHFWVQAHSVPRFFLSGQCAKQLGDQIWEILEIDLVDAASFPDDYFIRYLVELDICCPLKVFLYLPRQELPDARIQLQYERLGDFCYWCGCLGHVQSHCLLPEIPYDGSVSPFGPWLRASPLATHPAWCFHPPRPICLPVSSSA